MVMKKIRRGTNTYHVGFFPRKGLVVYDAEVQDGTNDSTVRLFIVRENRMASCDAETVRENLLSADDYFCDKAILPKAQREAIDEAVGAYCRLVQILRQMRHTHCYSCKRYINSVDFSLCEDCGWIRCECGHCGCQYEGYLENGRRTRT